MRVSTVVPAFDTAAKRETKITISEFKPKEAPYNQDAHRPEESSFQVLDAPTELHEGHRENVSDKQKQEQGEEPANQASLR